MLLSDRGPFQRCIGNRNSHFYSLNYTLDFVHAYQGVNKWAHVMSLAGHEDSGTVAETLDDDLMEFLQSVLDTKDELVIFLMADHGMRYGEWFKVLDGSHEHKLPSLFLLASTSLLRDVPFAISTLQHNTERLVSKLDLHKTLAYLGELPYYRGWTDFDTSYSEWKTKSGGTSLFTTKIPNHRTCESAFVPSFFCSCLKFKEIDRAAYTTPQDPYASFLVNYFAEEIIRQINDEVYTSARTWPGQLCQKLRLNRVELVEWQFLSTSRHYYKLVLSVQESKSVRFEAVVLLSASYLPAHSLQTGYRVLPIFTEGRRQFRIMYIKRQDAYAGMCEEMSKALGVPAALCVCNSIADISLSFPSLFLSLQSNYQRTLAPVGLSCDLHCESQGLLCLSAAIELLNICTELKKLAGCSQCYEAENQKAYPGVRQGLCFVSRQKDFECGVREAGVSRVCTCAVHS